MSGGWDPCLLDAFCENCDHPMAGHFRENVKGYSTRCGQCRCEHWCCRHGGMRALVTKEEAAG